MHLFQTRRCKSCGHKLTPIVVNCERCRAAVPGRHFQYYLLLVLGVTAATVLLVHMLNH
ncbi:MAG: hypothetical protein KGJ62_00565 [Armatimonadetes bacterium]|nr:hypothetical protein [Armatimonadota bacterium]